MTTITYELQQTLEVTPNIKHVHFTAAGTHHFRVFEYNKSLYTRLNEVPKKTESGLIIPNKFELVPIKDNRGKDDPQYLITETLTREQVLSATPVNKPKPSGITKGDVLELLEITDEDLKKVLSSKKK